MNKLILPPFLKARLEEKTDLAAGVHAAIADFQQLLDVSKLPFFEDYTDHGIAHLNGVLASAVGLMPKKAHEVFSAEDAATLILAVLLHDSAMHISKDGFYFLVKGEASKNRIPEFDNSDDWQKLWDNFYFTARHWDDHKRNDVFGDNFDGHISDPFDKYSDLRETDRRLIGEFVRIHHPRLAHEFAVYGVLGVTGNLISLDLRLTSEMRDLAGLIARSHGLPLRRCIDYLKEKHNNLRDPSGVHAVYLMVILRIADYLQVKSERSPKLAFKYKHIPSQLSRLEHSTHKCINHISYEHDDPESIFVEAKPPVVSIYLNLKKWLDGIQKELDDSWAVLGEVYGAKPRLKDLGLVLRRVRSSLDDKAKFAKSVDYFPEKVEFGVARPELLKLLIRPLYGERPEIGIRELLQNAVDAVQERWAYEERHPEAKGLPTYPIDCDVEIWLDNPDETGFATLTVTDKGIGMTEEIVRDYFLTAGASYRYSDAWRKEFEKGGKGEDATESRVMRSGRFGIGVLAAFLLGDEIEVTTRRIGEEMGFKFNTDFNYEFINMKVIEVAQFGTVIKVRITGKVHRQLMEAMPVWDWFILANPSVKRKIGQNKHNVEQKEIIHAPGPKIPNYWREINILGYSYVYWTFRFYRYKLVCNGIRLPSMFPVNLTFMTDTSIKIRTPQVIVFDNDGKLPVDLKRDRLTIPHYPFHDELLLDVFKDTIAEVLVKMPDRFGSWHQNGYSRAISTIKLFGITFYGWAVNNDGVLLFDGTLLSLMNTNAIMFCVDEKRALPFSPSFEGATTRQVYGKFETETRNGKVVSYEKYIRELTRIRTKAFEKLFSDTIQSVLCIYNISNGYENSIQPTSQQNIIGNWVCLTKGEVTKPHVNINLLADTEYATGFAPSIIEVHTAKPAKQITPSPLAKLWLDIIGPQVIPFDPVERRTKLAKAYEILAPYIKAHEAMKREEDAMKAEKLKK